MTPRRVSTATEGTDTRALIQHRLLQGPLSPEDERIIGDGVGLLVLQPREWVNRRVEQITFVDDQTVRRQTSIDLVVPFLRYRSVAQMVALAGGLVPLALLHKEKLERFSVWDDDARPLPLLTTTENGLVSGAILVAMATRLVELAGQPLPIEVADVLRFVAGVRGDVARFVVDEMAESPNRLRARLARLRGLLRAYSTPVKDSPESLDLLIKLGSHADLVSYLMGVQAFRSVIDDLAGQFIMIVRLQGELSRRRVIKFRFDQAIRRSQRARRFRRVASGLAESIGWKAKPFDFDRIAVGSSQSYHVEVSAPAQLEFTEARFLAVDTSTERKWSDEVPDPMRSEYVHMHLRIDAEHARSIVGRVEVRFRAARLGLPLLGAGLASLIAAVLLVGWSRASQIDPAGGSALLLLGPTLLAALIVRPGEHALATKLLLGLRAVVVIVGIASFVAAGALAAKYTTKPDPIWAVATLTACGCAGTLLLTQLLHPGALPARLGARLVRRLRLSVRSLRNAAVVLFQAGPDH